MVKQRNLAVVLAATTFLTAGVAAYAADQATKPASAQTAAMKDEGKLSTDGSKAYLDIAMARLAIFDGRTKDAKTFVDDADSALGKAKTDDSVFMKAEANLKSPEQAAPAGSADATNAKAAATDKTASTSPADPHAAKQAALANSYAATTPKRWLPVDAEMSVNEDFAANPKKAAAVAEANKSLAKGDKQGAMQKLKLADVDIDYVMAVLPLDQTLADVHQAAQLVDGGKYYEASQMLRQVQDSTRYDLLDVSAVPKPEAEKPAPATH